MKKVLSSVMLALVVLLTGCSSNERTPLKELAEAYAEIADNNQEVMDAFQAVYKASRDEQETLQQKAISLSGEVKNKNASLAEKAKNLATELQGSEILCEASQALGITAQNASFTTVDAGDKLANIVIDVAVEGEPNGTPYFQLKDGEEVLYKSAARYSDGKVFINFRLTTNKGATDAERSRLLAKTKSILLVTADESKAGVISNATPATEQEIAQEQDAASNEPEPAFEGLGESNSVETATTGGDEIKKGANLVAALKAAGNVTYDYNADSGIWAHVGNVWIVIDEDQLNRKGIDFINSIVSDMAHNIKFSPDMLKPDAKILQIEKD